MSEERFTPGPWAIYDNREGLSGRFEIWANDARDEVASVAGGKADARLITASLDLYEACKALGALDCCEGYTLPRDEYLKLWDALGKARAAIAKAEGRV